MDNKKKVLKQSVKKPRKSKRVKKAKFTGESKSRKNLVLLGGAIALVIILSAVIFLTLSSLFSTESYYVLNQNVKAKQQITPEMVVVRETAAGTGPVNALTMEEIQRGGVYSRYPLYAGDVVSYSNAGPLSGQSLGIPDDWSVTSFSINSTDAVGGTLGKGDYIDIIGVNQNGAQYIFNNLLILDIKFVNEEYDGNTDGQTIVGETIHYTVGLPAEDVGYFHSALYEYTQGEASGVIRIIKAPYIINYADRDVSNLDQPFKYGPNVGNIDLIEGTDPTFTDVERDENGRPINATIEIDKDDFHLEEPVKETEEETETKVKVDQESQEETEIEETTDEGEN